MEIARDVFRLVHILSVIFMSAPFYSLIVVNERARIGGADFKVNRYLENMIKGQSLRCFVFQFTALLTGIGLVIAGGMGMASIVTNWVLLAKTGILVLLIGLLSVVHFSIQPKIEALLAQVNTETVPPEISAKMVPLRIKRKKMAAFCLFLVLTAILLGMQVYARFNPAITVTVLVLAALFSWRVYKIPVSYGWI